MKTIEINLNQPRVANVAGNTTTVYEILKGGDDVAYIFRQEQATECEEYGFKRAARVEVTHPAVMVGDWDELESDIQAEIEAAALAEGVCVANKYGVLFVK